MVITYFIAQLGTVAITTKVYTQNIMMFIFLFSIAIGQGSQILIGHMVGAGETKDAYERGIKSLRIAALVSLSVAIVVFMFADHLLGIVPRHTSIIDKGVILSAT